MDKILEQVKVIYGHYVLAVARAKKIEKLQMEIESLLHEKADDLKGYENALKKLKDKSSRKGKALDLIKKVKQMQKISIIKHYESKTDLKNATKEQD
jgi:hypothetical protein